MGAALADSELEWLILCHALCLTDLELHNLMGCSDKAV